MKKTICLTALFLSLALGGFCETIQTITLRDQSTIRGEILGMKDGVYTVKSPTLGMLQIPAGQVASIVADETVTPIATAPRIREGGPKKISVSVKKPNRPTPQAARPAPEEPEANSPDYAKAQEESNTKVKSMMMNPNFADKVQGMSESKEMEDVLSDPETMTAIQNFDYETLMNNEKMKRLMESPDIKGILGETGGQ